MKNKITAVALMVFMLFLVACSKDVEVTTPEGQEAVENLKPEDSLEEFVETEETTEITEEVEEQTEEVEEQQLRVEPLPSIYNLNALEDCILAVSLNESSFYKDSETDEWRLKATVYEYELFDMVDISQLEVGDIIVLNTKDVQVDKIERLETGNVAINGGLDVGGYELRTDEDGVYYETGYSDVKSYYSIGEIDVKLIDDFAFIDESNDEEHVAVLSVEEAQKLVTEYEGYCNPNNTFVTIAEGEAFEMRVIYTP